MPSGNSIPFCGESMPESLLTILKNDIRLSGFTEDEVIIYQREGVVGWELK